MIIVEVKCPICGSVSLVEVDAEAFDLWQGGELVQNAFPNLSATEREKLISGMCEDCQKKIFG